MYELITPDTLLYRITRDEQTWPTVLDGLGAYFTSGGRYNEIDQATLYACPEPFVAICEYAFHLGIRYQKFLATAQPLKYPLKTDHWLWCFRIDEHPPAPMPEVIDLSHPQAQTQFQYPQHFLHNPLTNYTESQQLSNRVRIFTSPQHPRPDGLKAPSVRTPATPGYQPEQYALFVFPPTVRIPYSQRATLKEQWKITFEFAERHGSRHVNFQTQAIDWSPYFRLQPPSTTPVPTYAPNPNSRSYSVGPWYKLTILY